VSPKTSIKNNSALLNYSEVLTITNLTSLHECREKLCDQFFQKNKNRFELLPELKVLL
jgi:hypothetical protein